MAYSDGKLQHTFTTHFCKNISVNIWSDILYSINISHTVIPFRCLFSKNLNYSNLSSTQPFVTLRMRTIINLDRQHNGGIKKIPSENTIHCQTLYFTETLLALGKPLQENRKYFDLLPKWGSPHPSLIAFGNIQFSLSIFEASPSLHILWLSSQYLVQYHRKW